MTSSSLQNLSGLRMQAGPSKAVNQSLLCEYKVVFGVFSRCQVQLPQRAQPVLDCQTLC